MQRAIGVQPASVHLVPLYFERDDLIGALTEHGYRPDARTFFIWEGVTKYLTEDAVRATLGALQASPAGSRLVFTYVRKDFIDGVNMYDVTMLYRRFRQRQQVWRFGLDPDEVSAFIAEYGWRSIQQAGSDYFVRHYIEPAGRNLTASQLEWSAYAQKDSIPAEFCTRVVVSAESRPWCRSRGPCRRRPKCPAPIPLTGTAATSRTRPRRDQATHPFCR